jgi:hypothetical protein
LAALCGACVVAAPVTNAAILSDLLVPGATFTVGPLTFGDFTWSTSQGTDPSQVTINPYNSGTTYGICIQGPLSVGFLFPQIVDIGLTYTVTAAAPIIGGLHNEVNLGGFGASAVIISENVKSGSLGPLVGYSTIGAANGAYTDLIDPPGELAPPQTLADVINWTPVSKVWVNKDILMAAGANSMVAATIIYQGFSVPEPSTYAMLAGLGLVGFALYRRMKA